jgi:hypothetical protein
MAQYESSYPQSGAERTGAGEISGWAVGFTFFASAMMVLIGSFHFIAGFAAVLDDTFYVVRPGFDLKMDVTTWGWIHMIGGIVLVIAGVGLITGSLIARIIAIFMAGLSVIWSFYSIPYYPVWSIVTIALAIGVIWALTVHGKDLAMEE